MEIILASSSPRRRDLLSTLVESFQVVLPRIDESVNDGELPAHYVERLAISKAKHCMKEKTIVIAADTCVSIENEILGKPVNKDHARAMLQRLSGRKHQVYTGLAILAPKHRNAITVMTTVQFSVLDDAVIDGYLNTDEPYDKAGAYGIQGIAGSFVSTVEGSYSSVVGLPLCEAREALQKCGAVMKVGGQTGGH